MPYHFINIPVNVCVRTSSTSIALGVEVDFDCDVDVDVVAMEDFLAWIGSPFCMVFENHKKVSLNTASEAI